MTIQAHLQMVYIVLSDIFWPWPLFPDGHGHERKSELENNHLLDWTIIKEAKANTGHDIITTAPTGHKSHYQPVKWVGISTWGITGRKVQHNKLKNHKQRQNGIHRMRNTRPGKSIERVRLLPTESQIWYHCTAFPWRYREYGEIQKLMYRCTLEITMV